MEITWYGQSCFRLRDYGRAVVTDPYNPEIGLRVPRVTASLVTVSHDHNDHNHVQALRGSPYVVAGPGEYEIGGIFVVGIATFHDDRGGAERGPNTAYLIEFDDLTVCHLGDLGHIPSQEQIEQFNDVDILLIPVGGRSTLSGARAAEVVNLIEPRIVIPMHYRIPGLAQQSDTATRFLSEMAVEKPTTVDTFKITRSQLPDQTQVVLLEVKQ